MAVIAIDQQPRDLPFLDAVAKRFGVRFSREEMSLLATYERYWLMIHVLGPLRGAEKRYVKTLAKKHKSFIRHQL